MLFVKEARKQFEDARAVNRIRFRIRRLIIPFLIRENDRNN